MIEEDYIINRLQKENKKLKKLLDDIEIKTITCYWGNEDGNLCIFLDELYPIIKRYNKLKEK